MITNLASVRRRLSDNIKRVRDQIGDACERAKREPSEITLVAVTKYVEVDVIRQALDLGILDIGESRPQQLNQRAGMIHEYFERKNVLGGRREAGVCRPRWHMVGHLQRNKVKLVVPWAELIHSVDSLRLAEDLHNQATRLGRTVDILLQVNTSGERSKFGIAVGAAPHLAEHLAAWKGIRLCGLMTMAPIDADETELRLVFDRLRDVFEDMAGDQRLGTDFKHLSMGMSHDFQTAIAAGATLVRIGSLLFDGLSKGPESQEEDDG